MLTRDGHEVFVAQDGLEGVKSFYDLQPDLVITDIVMPNKDGIELIADLRSSNPNQPIIAMSGGRRLFSATSDLNEIEITGVKRLLQKPFTLQQLRESVDLALG
jgi:DNA-binding response OmpR family regulator